jgi:hypothetical protein
LISAIGWEFFSVRAPLMVTTPLPLPPRVNVVSIPWIGAEMVAAKEEFCVMAVAAMDGVSMSAPVAAIVKLPDAGALNVIVPNVREPERVIVPAAPTPGFPPKTTSSPSRKFVLVAPPSMVQLESAVALLQIPPPLLITPLLCPAESKSQVLVAAGAAVTANDASAAVATRPAARNAARRAPRARYDPLASIPNVLSATQREEQPSLITHCGGGRRSLMSKPHQLKSLGAVLADYLLGNGKNDPTGRPIRGEGRDFMKSW